MRAEPGADFSPRAALRTSYSFPRVCARALEQRKELRTIIRRSVAGGASLKSHPEARAMWAQQPRRYAITIPVRAQRTDRDFPDWIGWVASLRCLCTEAHRSLKQARARCPSFKSDHCVFVQFSAAERSVVDGNNTRERRKSARFLPGRK